MLRYTTDRAGPGSVPWHTIRPGKLSVSFLTTLEPTRGTTQPQSRDAANVHCQFSTDSGIFSLPSSHTRTQSVVRATTQVNGKTGNSTPCHAQTP